MNYTGEKRFANVQILYCIDWLIKHQSINQSINAQILCCMIELKSEDLWNNGKTFLILSQCYANKACWNCTFSFTIFNVGYVLIIWQYNMQ